MWLLGLGPVLDSPQHCSGLSPAVTSEEEAGALTLAEASRVVARHLCLKDPFLDCLDSLMD